LARGSSPACRAVQFGDSAEAYRIADWYFCLGGTLRIETRAPRGEWLTAVGRSAIPPNTAHRISNGGNGEDCRFLLLQGVGVYDFNKITAVE
jgi:hypothetical protein